MSGLGERVDAFTPWFEAAAGLLLGGLAVLLSIPEMVRERGKRMGTLSRTEAAALRDATLENLLAAGWPWDVDRVKAVILAVARERGEVSANDVRDLLEERLHWLIAPAFNSLSHQKPGPGALVNTGRTTPSTSEGTKGHGVRIYRLAPAAVGEAA